MKTPTWLTAYLTATGRANTDGIGRTITVGLCHRCRAQIVRGLDADRCAIPVTCDPTPITTIGEALALITNRHTYDLTGPDRQPHLTPRDHWRIRRPRTHPVLAEHTCGQPLPAEPPQPTPPTAARSDEVPF